MVILRDRELFVAIAHLGGTRELTQRSESTPLVILSIAQSFSEVSVTGVA